MEWGAHIHHSWDVCVTSNCSFGPKRYFWTRSAFIFDNVVFFRPSCFSTKHRLQEFGIGRSPTHRVVFRSFPFLLCKLSKQTNKHFTFLPSCFHVALYSTLVAHRLIFVRFLCSKFYPIPRICSQLDRLEIALNRFSLSRLAIWNALSQKIFVRRVQCKLSMTYCKSFPNLQFSRKKEVGIVKCSQKEGFWTIHRVGGSMGENPPFGWWMGEHVLLSLTIHCVFG